MGRTRGQGDKGTRAENLKQVFPLVPNSPCPLAHAPCPMPHAQCLKSKVAQSDLTIHNGD
jgi:hypothetical protein